MMHMTMQPMVLSQGGGYFDSHSVKERLLTGYSDPLLTLIEAPSTKVPALLVDNGYNLTDEEYKKQIGDDKNTTMLTGVGDMDKIGQVVQQDGRTNLSTW